MGKSIQNPTTLVVARRIWKWGGWVFSFATMAAAKQLLTHPGSDKVVDAAVEAIGVFLLTGGVCLFLTWVIYQIWSLLPSQQFRSLEQDLILANNMLSYIDPTPRNLPHIRYASRRLDKLNIPNPGLQGSTPHWKTFLMRIIGEAKAGTIKEAKSLWEEIKEEEDANETDA